ncbi:hypothetical protein ROA7450_02963 [Roseovarius albus]|uniref:Uncharacterized protein n=1 Tax=Roseovarius albus TaxID=1247867 RepID=A0A1X6ZNV3_9RHOB|nr:hypothetical protein ROA7450_02963 [Roseovarius albus]
MEALNTKVPQKNRQGRCDSCLSIDAIASIHELHLEV